MGTENITSTGDNSRITNNEKYLFEKNVINPKIMNPISLNISPISTLKLLKKGIKCSK